MPSWSQVLNEIKGVSLDDVRRKYLKQLREYRKRDIICYYSGWLQKPGNHAVAISDDDKNGFMNAVHGLKRDNGLDLILHTPGGDLAATESIVHYLRSMFGTDINVFVPQLAMSAGTMIACAARKVYLGKQSNLGPIDPQFNGIPAQGVIEEFEQALKSVKDNPSTLPIWQTIIQKYHPTFIGECQKAIELSDSMVRDWLLTGMFESDSNANTKVDAILSKLGSHVDSKTHSRHFHFDEISDTGLIVERLEKDQGLQDLILTIHHAYIHTLANSSAYKIIENHEGSAIVAHAPEA